MLGLAATDHLLIAGTVALAVAGLLVTRRLHAGYIDALERNLVRRFDQVHGTQEALDETLFQESTQLDLSAMVADIGGLGTGIAIDSFAPERFSD